ncbi:CHAT domain-containing protein [Melanogaster broomeanus]|nr:CHAT domain-containing protein [Melanogaster broomeanus]
MHHYYKDHRESHLDDAITAFERVVDRCPPHHPGRGAALSNLAMAKFTSCQATEAHLNLDEPIHLYQEALDLRPPGHPNHPSTLINLSIALLSHFRGRGYVTVADAEELLRGCLDICPPHSHEYRAVLFVIAFSSHSQGDEKPISSTLLQATSSSWRLPFSVNELNRLLRECRERNDPWLLDQVIEQLRDAVKHFTTVEEEWQGDGKDLEEAIQLHRTALQLRPEGHSDRSHSLSALAAALSARFEQQGDGKDFEEAMQLHRAALQLMPEGHPDHSGALNNLATALSTQFKQQGNEKDLEEAIQHHRTVLQLRPEGHPDCSGSLNNLANALSTRFEQQGDQKDLEEAIQLHRTALQLRPEATQIIQLPSATLPMHSRPEGHPDHSASLNNLANALSTQYDQQGDGKDLDEAIQLHSSALQLRSEGHPGHSASINNLATALSTRFEHQGDGKDLADAIQHHRAALHLMSEGHPGHSGILYNLGAALSTQFEQQGDEKDLDEAIQHLRTALLGMPEGHPYHSHSLNSLATALSRRFQHRGDGKDLEEATQHYRTALLLQPEGHPDHSHSLNNLANVLLRLFQQQGDGKDLDEAIQHYRTALQLRSKDHPDHSASLNGLAAALTMRFKWHQCNAGDGKDLDDAIQHYRTALQLMPDGHPGHSASLTNLAATLLRQFEQQGDDDIIQEALQHACAAAEQALSPSHQLHAQLQLACIHHVRMHFPQDLSVNAASCALRHGNICHAVELLEQGRALHWTQLARFRTTLDEFQSYDARTAMLANQFWHLSAMLNKRTNVSADEDCSIAAVEAKIQNYRDRLEEWNKVVEEIRTLEGFSRFLLPPLFTDFQKAACKGPAIVLIASKFSCDAIIVLHAQSPIHIQLQVTWEEMLDLVVEHLQNIHNSYGPDHNVFVKTMGRIWSKVIFPVVCELKRKLQKNSRIWWCPTSLFTALPLHTAGEYQQGGSVLSKLFISSYTPSLSALIKAHKGQKMTSDVKFVAIGQASPDQDMLHQPLQYVEAELDAIERLLPTPPVTFTKLTSLESTRQEALHKLKDHQWFHLSCHGQQVLKEPFKSCFVMKDGPLSLLDIISANISGHEFAFLSAYEVIHLAAGLQFMGVKSVIGTLWKVGDELAYKLVSAYYKEFCKNGTMDCTMAAEALHKAVALLAKENVPLEERAMFVHIGI